MLLPKLLTLLGVTTVAVWAALHRREFIFAGAPNQRRWRDLRVWAVLLMAGQAVIYLLFG